MGIRTTNSNISVSLLFSIETIKNNSCRFNWINFCATYAGTIITCNMKGMPIRNCYYVLAQQLSGEIIRAPNTAKKFNELLFVFFIVKEGLPVCGFIVFSPVAISFSLQPLRFRSNVWCLKQYWSTTWIASRQKRSERTSEKSYLSGRNLEKSPYYKTSILGAYSWPWLAVCW